jgi:ABC-type transporter lipoprotein component MlaA
MINSTLGIGGFFEIAGKKGLDMKEKILDKPLAIGA